MCDADVLSLWSVSVSGEALPTQALSWWAVQQRL